MHNVAGSTMQLSKIAVHRFRPRADAGVGKLLSKLVMRVEFFSLLRVRGFLGNVYNRTLHSRQEVLCSVGFFVPLQVSLRMTLFWQ